jgi:hypothetical protein
MAFDQAAAVEAEGRVRGTRDMIKAFTDHKVHNAGPEVFHFTDTARLPWILRAGHLEGGRNKIGGLRSPPCISACYFGTIHA